MNNHQNNYQSKRQSEQSEFDQLIHDARGPLNIISMQAEMIKLLLEKDMPIENAIDAANKIIISCQTCSQTLEQLSTVAKNQANSS
tara:strand:+ start:4050 stop:4307 length:258 start_codon:yes stop_codon:yes gene_type:complete